MCWNVRKTSIKCITKYYYTVQLQIKSNRDWPPNIVASYYMSNSELDFLITKPTRCINFSDLFLEWNSTCFAQFLCPSLRVFHCTYSNGICRTGLLTACEQDQDGVLSLSCLQALSKPVWHTPLLCVQWKTPDYGQRNCTNHVHFHSKNKFEKLVHLVGFVISTFLKFILRIKLYMFRTVPLSIIRSFSLYTQQWYMSYRFADNLRAGSGWSSILILLESC